MDAAEVFVGELQLQRVASDGLLECSGMTCGYPVRVGLDSTGDSMDILGMDMISLASEYAGKWVALDPDGNTVLASGESASVVYRAAQGVGVQSPMVLWVLDNYGGLAPCQQ